MKEDMEKGVQPLDTLLTELNLENHTLVEVSKEQLTHRMVAKGRKGRRLTANAQHKILNALNALVPDKEFSLSDLFNYNA